MLYRTQLQFAACITSRVVAIAFSNTSPSPFPAEQHVKNTLHHDVLRQAYLAGQSVNVAHVGGHHRGLLRVEPRHGVVPLMRVIADLSKSTQAALSASRYGAS